MMKRLFWLTVLALAVVLLPALAAAEVELVVWHAYRGKEKAAFEKVVDMFNKDHADDMRVTTLAVPYDAYADKITAAVPRGKGPDVFIFAQDRLGGWVEAGNTMEPIDFYLYPEIIDQYIPSTMAAMQYQGNTYGLPVNFKVVTMIYNTDMVASPPKTSGELITVAKQHTNQASGKFGLAYAYSDFYYHSALMNAFGGGVFKGSRDPVLNRPENVKSLELMLQWLNVDKVMPAEPSSSLITMLFNQGDAAIVFSGPWFLAEISDAIPYALATLPTIDEAGGAPMQPWMTVEGAYISAPGQHKDHAFDFVLYLAGATAGRVMALEGRQTPANKLVYDDVEVAGDTQLSAFRAQVEHAVPMPNYAEMTMVWSPATTAMNSIVRGAASPQAALDQAQKDVEERVKSLRK